MKANTECGGFRFQARLWGFIVPESQTLPPTPLREGGTGELVGGGAHLQGVHKAQPWPPGGSWTNYLVSLLPHLSKWGFPSPLCICFRMKWNKEKHNSPSVHVHFSSCFQSKSTDSLHYTASYHGHHTCKPLPAVPGFDSSRVTLSKSVTFGALVSPFVKWGWVLLRWVFAEDLWVHAEEVLWTVSVRVSAQ